MTTVLQASSHQFVDTPPIEQLVMRSLRYLRSGYAVHLRGPAGTGKTTLALHLANLLARPIMVMIGDDAFKSSDLVGTQSGFTRKQVVDKFIHSVVKVEDELQQTWVESRLTLACKEGLTLIYDEFNRSRPEGNNVLLSVLEEKLLILPPSHQRQEYIRVHPEFRAIFTSNPEEYCGVHSAQNALLDRMITLNIPEPDESTQIEILVRKTDISQTDAVTIVRLVKAFRNQTHTSRTSGLRSALMLANICCDYQIPVIPDDADFRELCQDVLLARCPLSVEEAAQVLQNLLIQFGSVPFDQQNTYPDLTLDEPESEKTEWDGIQLSESASEEHQEPRAVDFQRGNVFETLTDLLSANSVQPIENDFENSNRMAPIGNSPLLESQLSCDRRIMAYLQVTQGARLLEIEQALELSRAELISTLKILLREKQVIQHDRLYKLRNA